MQFAPNTRLFTVLIFLLFVVPVYAQQHIELLDRYHGDFRRVSSEMESMYAHGQVTPREYKQFKRWEQFVSPSIGRDGVIHNTMAQDRQALKKYLHAHPEVATQSRLAHGAWTDITPGDFDPSYPSNGRLNSIAVHPTNSNIIYVGSAFGGVWKTTNGGTTWSNLTDGLAVIAVSSILIDPSNTNHLYILTGDGDGRYVPSIGILESYDAGLSWVATALSWNVETANYGYKLLMDPGNSNRMFMTSTEGIFRTTDGWNSVDTVATFNARDIDFKPGNTNILYATQASSGSGTARVYRSQTGGDSWVALTSGYGLPNNSLTKRVEIAVSPDNPEMVAALFAGADTFGLYVSFTGADTFYLFSNQPNIVGGQTGYDLTIVANPLDASEIFVGGYLLWKSYNYGVGGSWIQLTDNNNGSFPDIHADIHDIYYNGSRMLVATDGGLAESLDGGTTWSNLSDGLSIMQYYFIDVRPGSTVVMGGAQDNGTTKWIVGDPVGELIQVSDGMECLFNPDVTNAWYVSSQTNRWRWDEADSASWTMITPPNDNIPHWKSAWLMHPDNHDTLYSAWRNISRTYDRGDTWTDLNPGFTNGRNIEAMVQCNNFDDVMYASDGWQVKLTGTLHNDPPEWADVTTDLPIGLYGDVLTGMTIDPENLYRVWAVLGGYDDGEKVYYTDDAGASWHNMSGSLPNVPGYCIKYQPGSNDGLYLGNDLGVFYRNANMDDWIYFSNGMPTVQVHDIAFSGSFVYAGTFGRGMWKSLMYSGCSDVLTLTPDNDPSLPNSTGIQEYSANFYLYSTRIITGGPGTDVTYHAGTYIRFDPGFNVKTGNVLHAKIEGCPD